MVVNKIRIILGITSSVFLFIALINGLPYGYFTILRFVTCGSSIYFAWIAYNEDKLRWAWSFALLAILFNPILPIHLNRELWRIIDFIFGIYFTMSIFLLKKGTKIKKAQL